MLDKIFPKKKKKKGSKTKTGPEQLGIKMLKEQKDNTKGSEVSTSSEMSTC